MQSTGAVKQMQHSAASLSRSATGSTGSAAASLASCCNAGNKNVYACRRSQRCTALTTSSSSSPSLSPLPLHSTSSCTSPSRPATAGLKRRARRKALARPLWATPTTKRPSSVARLASAWLAAATSRVRASQSSAGPRVKRDLRSADAAWSVSSRSAVRTSGCSFRYDNTLTAPTNTYAAAIALRRGAQRAGNWERPQVSQRGPLKKCHVTHWWRPLPSTPGVFVPRPH